jgi:hypothetical protein
MTIESPAAPHLGPRVHIVGAAGSGKTFLAAALARALDVEHVQLDRLAFTREHDIVAWPKRYAAAVSLAAGPGWVCEGIYLGWTEPLLAAADTIVWLDLPWRTSTRRIVSRHIRNSLRGDNQWKGVRLLLRFLWSTRLYYLGPAGQPGEEHTDESNSRRMMMAALAPYQTKVVRCRNRDEVAALIARLSVACAQ